MSGTDVGIGIGVVAAILLLGILIYCFCLKKRKPLFQNDVYESTLVSDQNLIFYRNQMKSKPDGETIETILNVWKGDYKLLEKNHNYIQWLFPNRNPGVNPYATTLTDKEAQIIRDTPELRNRVKRCFEMMLDFYGMELDGITFKLTWNYQERLQELNKWGNHNFLRISRILLALKELGHQELMLPWMKFLAELIYKEKVLTCAESSFENYWLETLDAEDKIAVTQYKNTLIQSKDAIQSNE